MADNKTSAGERRGFKEFMRRQIVSLKRSPQRIPLFSLVTAFLIYSLNLSAIANTTARINGANMGQCEFAAMLLSILSFVVFLRTFPRRKKADKVMLVLLSLMLAFIVFVDAVYLIRIESAVYRPDNPIIVDRNTIYISTAYNVVAAHIVFICVTAGLIALLPVYSKAIKKINTSIDVEGNESMAAIDIGEDQ